MGACARRGVSAAATLRLLLRVAHGLSAALWLGGGAYYALLLRPLLKGADEGQRRLARAAQREFGEWAGALTLAMVATGALLTFDRLSDGQGTLLYAALLGAKIAAALTAFWLAGSFTGVARRASGHNPSGPPRRISRSAAILLLGTVAFVLGVALAASYPTGIGQR